MIVEQLPNGKFVYKHLGNSLGKFRGVQNGDTFTYQDVKYRVVGYVESTYDGTLFYTFDAEAI